MNNLKSYNINESSSIESYYDVQLTTLSGVETFSQVIPTYLPPFDNFGIAFAAGLIIPMSIIGFFSNVITIMVISQSRNLKSIFNLYIMSLSVSDLVSSLNSILILYYITWGFVEWKISVFLCKLCIGGKLATSIATSFHILVFCALRLVSIAKPHVFNRFQIVHAKISIIVLWIFSVLTGAFTHGMWINVKDIDRSKEFRKDFFHCRFEKKWMPQLNEFNIYGNGIFYYIPLIGIVIFSISICYILLKKRIKRQKARNNSNSINEAELSRQKKENQAFVQLLLIVISYLIGYIPQSIVYMILFSLSNATAIWWSALISFLCTRISECLNPFFYNIASSKLRGETKILLRKLFRCKQNPQRVSTERTSNNSTALRERSIATVTK